MDKIKLSKPVRRHDSEMEMSDVLSVKKALNRIGFYEEPDYGITPFPDERLFKSIEKFQEKRI